VSLVGRYGQTCQPAKHPGRPVSWKYVLIFPVPSSRSTWFALRQWYAGEKVRKVLAKTTHCSTSLAAQQLLPIQALHFGDKQVGHLAQYKCLPPADSSCSSASCCFFQKRTWRTKQGPKLRSCPYSAQPTKSVHLPLRSGFEFLIEHLISRRFYVFEIFKCSPSMNNMAFWDVNLQTGSH